MRKVLLDTDILSVIMKRKDGTVLRRAIEYVGQHGIFAVSAVSVHEVLYGLHGKAAEGQLRKVHQAFARNAVVLPTGEDFERSGVVRGIARRKGRVLTLADCLIGATAERLGLPVATGNTAHFQAMIDAGLRIELENWRELGSSP